MPERPFYASLSEAEAEELIRFMEHEYLSRETFPSLYALMSRLMQLERIGKPHDHGED